MGARGIAMPTLKILKGTNEGTDIPIDADRFVLGRNPDCHIVIPITSVSREHAQILRIAGKYYIEDKQSRNKTFVNNQEITTRTLLNNNDRIRICDSLFAFMDPPATTAEGEGAFDDGGEESEGGSTVEAMLTQSSHLLLEQQPAERLRVMLEITANLSKTLELDKLLPKIVDHLF